MSFSQEDGMVTLRKPLPVMVAPALLWGADLQRAATSHGRNCLIWGNDPRLTKYYWDILGLMAQR